MRILWLSTLFVAFAGMAQSATVRLVQNGWSEGGPLRITFSATDTNLSGGIEDAELLDFTAVFSIPGNGPAVLTKADLVMDGFFYQSPANYFIKAENSLFSLYEITGPEATFGLFSDTSGSFIAFTGRSLQPVPEPTTAAMLGASMIALSAIVRRRRTWTQTQS